MQAATVSHRVMIFMDRRTRPYEKAKRWAHFFLAMMLVWIFMFVVAPLLEKIPAVKPMVDFIEETGIDATALFYTEVEEFGDAETHMRNTMDYLPKGN